MKTAFFHGGSAEPSASSINIPSLCGVRYKAPYGRDGRIPLLKVFIENVVSSEFDGKPLALFSLRALTAYVERYYGQPAAAMPRRQACYAGPSAGLAAWLQGYVTAGVRHFVLRFAGDHERQIEIEAAIRPKLVG